MAVFTVIDHTELTGTTASWAEASISASYDHLLLEASIRGAESAYWNNLWIRVGNGSLDTGANYTYTNLTTVNSSGPISGRATGQTKWAGQYIGSASTLADTFGIVKIWIPNYSTTANFKHVFATSVFENNSTTNSEWKVKVGAGLWSATAAITEIDLVLGSGSNFMANSTFDLYGILGV